jgi:hypothetical protein
VDVGQRDRPCDGIDAGRPDPEAEVQVVAGERLLVAQPHALLRPCAGQELLGERRSVVGQLRLLADQRDPAVEPLAPQRLHDREPRRRRAHDRDAARRVHRGTGALT